MFIHEQQLIAKFLSSWLVGPPEHIGSTAVPSLAAKPVIDIMAPIRSLTDSAAAIPVAERLGYLYFPYKSQQMHWFCKPSLAHRTHHLHLIALDSPLWRERLAFRDALRRDAGLRAEYQELKQKLAARYRNDREAYTDAKSSFIARVVQAVLEKPSGTA